ncbi:MAG TPA: segregation and condensation protein A [Thioploca sp.]|nr:MAG: segregation and condensation protein A [Gammaproteobacteria bacterium]HDN25705.1 segregation and condensation protein A [Thioploca sp.]
MSFDDLSKEQQIMVSMRKVLTSIIREITPEPGGKYPLSEETVEDIRMCFALIAAREKELAEEQGITNLARPHYADEPQTTRTVPLDQIQRNNKDH